LRQPAPRRPPAGAARRRPPRPRRTPNDRSPQAAGRSCPARRRRGRRPRVRRRAPRGRAGRRRAAARAAALAQAVDALGVTARVLVVGAHPDDEDTRLIAWLARGRHAETAYLSLTRGDGGQNLIGNELGEALGAVRTEELLAARRLDGGRQYFARAFDFGFSKSAEETFRHWPRDTVLGDVVRVVRAFRPHAVIAIFSGTPADGHGHHQASGILAREAYDAAADTARFPAAAFGPAWAVPKFYRNTSYRGAETATLRYDAGAYDPLLGRSYAELAALSRTQHKSQGQGGPERLGPSVVSMRREDTRVNAGTPAAEERDLFAGVDTSWAQVARTVRDPRARAVVDSLDAATAAARAAFDARDPSALVAPLARVGGCSPPPARRRPRASASRSRPATGPSSARSATRGSRGRSTTRRCSSPGRCSSAAGIAVERSPSAR
jgi:LmbE family N-acetylglucosaminyl deacetylase